MKSENAVPSTPPPTNMIYVVLTSLGEAQELALHTNKTLALAGEAACEFFMKGGKKLLITIESRSIRDGHGEEHYFYQMYQGQDVGTIDKWTRGEPIPDYRSYNKLYF